MSHYLFLFFLHINTLSFSLSRKTIYYVYMFLQSLVKSSWESRDRPTIIPQGVPYMVKLLRYYVSEDAVYLHLEHVKGELSSTALFSVLLGQPWMDLPYFVCSVTL